MRQLVFVFAIISSLPLVAQQQTADSLFAAGKYTEAIATYKKSKPTAYNSFQLGRIYRQLGNYTNAVANYKKGFLIDSLNTIARFEYGTLLFAASKKQEALTVFDKLIIEQPATATYHYHKGKCVEAIHGARDALPFYQKAVDINPDFTSARLDLITGLLLTRENARGIAVAKTGLALSPDYIVLHSLLGQCYYHNGDFKEAITHLQIVRAAGLATEGLVKMLGEASFQEGLYKESIAYYEAVNNEFSQSTAAYTMIAKNYLKLRDYKNAISNMETAVVLKQPKLNQEYVLLATIYKAMNDDKKVLEYLKMAKSEDPNDPVIAYQYCLGYDRYYADRAMKIKTYEEFIDRFPKDDYVNLAAARISDLKKELFLQPKK